MSFNGIYMYYFIIKVDYIISLLFILYNLMYTDLSIDSSNNLSASITARIPNCPILIYGLSIKLLY